MRAQPSTVEVLAPMRLRVRPRVSIAWRPRRNTPRSVAAFLAMASERLARSLDLQETLDSLAQLAVPALGEACIVRTLQEGNVVGDAMAVRHVDTRRHELLANQAHSAFTGSGALESLMRVAAGQQPTLLSPLATAAFLGEAGRPDLLLAELGVRTALLIPVVHSHRTTAVVVFLSASERSYSRGRTGLAEQLAARFALALEAAQMYRSCKLALEDRQETLATSIHDMMTPLTSIKGTVHRLRRSELSAADAPASEFVSRLDAIDTAANRMASALSALLRSTLPQPRESAHTPRQQTDLVDLTRRVIAAEQLNTSKHVINLRAPTLTLEGAWDAHQLERLLTNLIGNAVKYSAAGGVVDIALTREIDDDEHWAVLRVVDQGVGIPARDLPFVFEPFHRGSNVDQIAGNGLGLTSVYQVVKTHGGRLWVDSAEGKGTCVTVRLPVTDVTSSYTPPECLDRPGAGRLLSAACRDSNPSL